MPKSLVSVVMTAPKFDHYFPEALNSIIAQKYRPLEIVMVVESNYEKYLDILKDATQKDSSVSFILEVSKMPGFCYCINKAIELSNGNFIARMDTDDLCTEHRISVQLERLLSGAADIIGCKALAINDRSELIKGFNLAFFHSNKQIRRVLPFRNPIFHSSVMFRKHTILDVGGYKYDFHAQDHELWIRLSLDRSVRFENINQVLYFYRRHTLQATDIKNTRRHFNEISGFMTKYFLETGNPAYLVGALVTNPFIRKMKNYFRRSM